MKLSTPHKVAAPALAVLLSLWSSSAVAQDRDDRAPSGPNPYLFTTGLVTTAVAYTPALLVAMNSERAEDKYLYAPFAGPWLDLANRGPSDGDTLNRAMLVVDGIMQTVGGLELIASFMFVSSGSHTASTTAPTAQARIRPSRMPNNGYGVVAVGTF